MTDYGIIVIAKFKISVGTQCNRLSALVLFSLIITFAMNKCTPCLTVQYYNIINWFSFRRFYNDI